MFDDVSLTPFRISLQVAGVATLLCIAAGLPLTWWIWRSGRVLGSLLSSLVLLPLVLPPTVTGYYLLYGLGRQSAFGRFLIDDLGLRLIFTWQGAAIAAAVIALPLFVRTAQAGFEHIDRDLVDVAETMGKSRAVVFFRVVVPLAWPSLLAATLIAFARAFGEFGATVIVAGNIPGRTQTAPTAIYDAVQAGNDDLANRLALISVILVLAIISVVTFVAQRDR
ncbi:MAG: molybdate ABC transporter permease subunit [Dehalococcoidia bacterium]